MIFAGLIVSFNKNDIGDEISSEETCIEVAGFNDDGTISICWNDRSERCYLNFRLCDLMTSLASEYGNGD